MSFEYKILETYSILSYFWPNKGVATSIVLHTNYDLKCKKIRVRSTEDKASLNFR